MSARERWDVFCRVVDNYGDIGIAWRLARQLSAAPRAVRLFVDDLASFARIESRVDPALPSQRIDAVDVLRWPIDDTALSAASVVVEMLGCGLPPGYAETMAGTRPPPVWIDFEHLSAETWVDGFHGLPSPHPTRPVTKHFFYPGFGERSGGLLIEPGIDERRRAFVDDRSQVESFRARLGIQSTPAASHASLFAYADAPIAGLFDAFARSGSPWSIAVPDDVLSDRVDDWIRRAGAHESLTVTIIPFVDQDDYDRLLWSSDVNFVRGEDSFVRAQVAGRPFVWQPYRQPDGAEEPKRAAFDALYRAGAEPAPGALQTRFSKAWNDPAADIAPIASDWLASRSGLDRVAARWRMRIVSAPPLIDRLVAFAAARGKGHPADVLLN